MRVCVQTRMGSQDVAVCADNPNMQITSSTATRTQGSQGGQQIAGLLKQMRQLTEQLKSAATGDGDPKAKAERIKLLQAQIQMVQAQIAAIQRQQQQEQLNQQKTAQATQAAESPPARTPGLGESVDTYA
jgi:hypothetical protein